LAKRIQFGRVSHVVSHDRFDDRFFGPLCLLNIQTIAERFKNRLALHRVGDFCCNDKRLLLPTLQVKAQLHHFNIKSGTSGTATCPSCKKKVSV
tara:strand:- start:279 stop:560 length:282 start_codon:yes stop_codon:yes gene_type:complete